MIKEWTIQSLEELVAVSKGIISFIPLQSTIFCYGHLGAGKTTLITQIMRSLGYTGDCSSPTYSLVNSYELDGSEVHHIDLYRLDDIDEALHIGIENYLYPETYTFIEWPQIIEEIAPERTFKLVINVNPDGSRQIELSEW